MSLEPENLEPTPTAANRTLLPGIFLIVVGVLNLVGAGGSFALGFMFMGIPVEELERQLQNDPGQRRRMADLQKQGYNVTAKDFRNIYIYGGHGVGITALVFGLGIIVGGICLCA